MVEMTLLATASSLSEFLIRLSSKSEVKYTWAKPTESAKNKYYVLQTLQIHTSPFIKPLFGAYNSEQSGSTGNACYGKTYYHPQG